MYIVHGLTRSYFTRKVTGYLDYTDRPWRLEPCPPGDHADAIACALAAMYAKAHADGAPADDVRRSYAQMFNKIRWSIEKDLRGEGPKLP